MKAAINGEYISLTEFFKEKAISLAISAVAAVAGAFLSSAAGAIKTFAVNTATKFANTGFGKLAISLGNSVKDWAIGFGTAAKDWAMKAGKRNIYLELHISKWIINYIHPLMGYLPSGDWFVKMGSSAHSSMSSFENGGKRKKFRINVEIRQSLGLLEERIHLRQ